MNFAFVDPLEICSGLRRIYLGCNMKEARYAYSHGWAKDWVYEKYGRESTMDEFIEQRIETALTHEILHILCEQLGPSDEQSLAGAGVDYIDKEEYISSLD